MNSKIIIFLIAICISSGCNGQTKTTPMESKNNNPLQCDPENGLCEIPGATATGGKVELQASEKPVRIVYYTDPICSACWAIEPQLRKLKAEYGAYLHIDYRMGGLLPDWSYNGGGISKPSDVAHHWEELGEYYQMPIDGGVWLEDPLDSSYPPSIAFKAAQIQNEDKAVNFLRILREMLFLRKKNIAKWENIQLAATQSGLDTYKLKEDYDGEARRLFQEDLDIARKMGVRGFPTLFFTDADNNRIVAYGVRTYGEYEAVLLRIFPDAKKKTIDISDNMSLFKLYPTLTVKEYAVLSDISFREAETILKKLSGEGKIIETQINSGLIYSINT